MGNRITSFFANQIKNTAIVRKIKRTMFICMIVIMAIIFMGVTFYASVKGIFEKVGDFFSDVLDNIKISGNNIEIDQEYLEKAKSNLKKWGIEPESLGLGRT